jgi:hypothetical protein
MKSFHSGVSQLLLLSWWIIRVKTPPGHSYSKNIHEIFPQRGFTVTAFIVVDHSGENPAGTLIHYSPFTIKLLL